MAANTTTRVTRIPTQTIVNPATDSGLTAYNTTISKVPTNVANVFVTSVQNNTTQVNTNVQQTFTNANAAAGATTQVQFNDRGVLAGDPGFVYNKDTDSLTVSGNISTGTVRTNNLRYMNGDPMMFSYSNANVASYLPTYTGNLAAAQVTAINFVGNGALLSSITGAQVTGNVPSANFASEANRANVVMSSSQPNITSVGTLVNLTVEGNISSNNIAATNSLFANRIAGDGANISNITGAFVTGIVANAYYSVLAGTANTVSTNAQPNITSVGILTSLQVGGNLQASNASLGNMVYGNYFVGDGYQISNISGPNITGFVPKAAESNTAIKVTSSSQPNITSVGTLTGLTINGNIEAGVGNFDAINADYLIGDGSNITNLPSSSITGIVASAAQANVANVANTVAGANVTGTVANATQANVANVANTVAGANVTGTVADATHATVADSANTVAGANVTGTVASATNASVAASANTVAGANVLGQVSNALISGTVYTNAQPNITSVGTLTSLTVGGNITSNNANLGNLATANYFSGDGTNLSNIQAANINGKVANATHADTASVVTSPTQSTITQVGTLITLEVAGTTTANSISATGNISGNVITGNVFVGSGANLSNIQSGNIVGTVANATYATSAGSANSATTAGTVTTNAQPNITTVGTLAGLAVNGTTTLGAIGNVSISGGTNGQGISTDGSGNLSWVSFATQSYVSSEIGNLINGAPNALNTLNELSAALGNDASYSSTITNSLANKLSTSAFTSTADTWLATKSTTNVSEGTNQYYTVDRANTAIDNRVTKTFVDGLAVVANVANTALTVAGANVTGTVANATFATSAGNVAWANVADKPTFATVATSGSYNDLSDKPSIPSITGLATETYVDNKATWANISGKPTFSTVATSGSYNDLSDKPSIPSLTGYATTTYVDDKATWANISGKPTFATVATSGLFSDLTGDISTGNITLTGTGTSINAGGGNILTNEVTGTKFKFLNGLNSVTLTGQGATSVYTLNLPANAGTNGQSLTTDGTGNLGWSDRLSWTAAPVANNSTGTAGQIAYDAGGNLYVCVANDVWSKISGTTSW